MQRGRHFPRRPGVTWAESQSGWQGDTRLCSRLGSLSLACFVVAGGEVDGPAAVRRRAGADGGQQRGDVQRPLHRPLPGLWVFGEAQGGCRTPAVRRVLSTSCLLP